MRFLTPLYLFLFLFACTSDPEKELEYVLNMAGENRSELEKVLEHYKDDTLKQKAARFLIINMPGHGTFANSRTDTFYIALDTLLRTAGIQPDKVDRLIDESNALSEKLQYKEDLRHITSGLLINNIDQAFDVWEKEPFAKHLSFEDFCEYLLPYRVDNEPLEYWRDSISPFYKEIKQMGYLEGSEYSSFWACSRINDQLKEQLRPWLSNDKWPVTKSYHYLKRTSYGKCADFAVLATFVMRAKGIPVMIDFTPQWPFRSMGHTWNVVKANNGVNVAFGGVDTNPRDRHKPDAKMAKIYRKTYAANRESLPFLRENEPIPGIFQSPFLKDVTSEYFKGTDVCVNIEFPPSEPRKFVYLHVFDNKNWMPVCFAPRERGKALFREMGRDILYLPAYFVNNMPEPAAYPFYIDLKGETHVLEPDTTRARTLRLTRKYPATDNQIENSRRMINGKIQAANRPDFRDTVTFHTITENPMGERYALDVNPDKQAFRYWRYLAPDRSFGNIAELEFYQDTLLLNPSGKIQGTPGSYGNNGLTFDLAFDGNPLTYFDSPQMDYSWVGIDFGKPVVATRAVYIPRNDDNNVVPGQEYELLYYGQDGWISLGKKVAEDYFVEYDSIPDNALLLLRNHTKGQEERIFTHDGQKVTWW